LTTGASLLNRVLWFERAELHETCIRISGWHWTGRYEQRIDLANLDRVKTRAHAEVSNLTVSADGVDQPLHLEHGVMLWHWRLKERR
jgi:hypothetical protein